MVKWLAIFRDERTQLRALKYLLSLFGVKWNRLPDIKTIIRVNVCCINSAVFFIGTWILFYLIVTAVFCGVIMGAAALLGVK